MDVIDSILDSVGNTPLVRLTRFSRLVPPTLLAKVEMMNPGGSVKDRIGLAMIEAAEEAGLLQPGATIVEPTSGNTGAGLAMAAALRGYRCVFVMPDKMSHEKIALLRGFGAEVVICPTAVEPDSPESYYRVADRITSETPGAFQPNQYFNPANPEAHYRTTGPEIWRQTDGRIDVFVAGVGTGGTITGVSRYLKEQNPDVVVVGADPDGSIFSGPVRPYLVEGVGEDFWPDTFDPTAVDRYVRIPDGDSFRTARRLAREEGLLVGGSSGLAAFAGLEVAKDYGPDAVIVVLLPDTGRNYLTKIYNDDWMREYGFVERPRAMRVLEVLGVKTADTPALVSVRTDQTVREAIDLLHEYDVSQLPVSQGEEMVGSVHDASLLERVYRDPGMLHQTVAEVMDNPLPVVDADDSLEVAYRALGRGQGAALVSDGTRAVAILTRADLLEALAHPKA